MSGRSKHAGRSGGKRTNVREVLRAAVNIDALQAEIEELLHRAGRDPYEYRDWSPVLAQIRISVAKTAHHGASESPEVQQSLIASYCVRYEFNPIEMCFEMQSGHLTNEKPRRLFREYFERVADGELNIKAILTYNIDRFTRDRLIGEQWIDMLKRRGIDLHEVDEMEAPLPLARREDEYAKALYAAWRESKRTSKRIRDTQEHVVNEGGLIHPVRMYGVEPIIEIIEGRSKQVGGRIVPEEAAVLREASRRLRNGEAIYAIACDLNARGLRRRDGGLFTSKTLSRPLQSPTSAGLRRFRDRGLISTPIEAIFTEEEWIEHCELLAPQRRGPNVRHPMSNLGTCGACGSPIIASGNHYKCSRRHQANLHKRCESCGASDGCRCSGRRTASDGHVHATRKLEYLDRFLTEIALAATDASRAARSERDALADAAGLAERRLALETSQKAIDQERQALARQVRLGHISEREGDEELDDIRTRLAGIKDSLGEIRRRERELAKLDAEPRRLRELATKGTPEAVRQLVAAVIDHYVLWPVGDGGAYDGIDVDFVAGYDPPSEAVEALRAEMNHEVARHTSEARSESQKKVDEAVETRIFELWRQGMTHPEIARKLNDEGLKRSQAVPSQPWDANAARTLVIAVCRRRGVTYAPVPRKPTHRSALAREAFKAAQEFVEQGLTWDAISEQLNLLGLQPSAGGAWDGKRLSNFYRLAAARYDTAPSSTGPGGRPRTASPQLSRAIWAYRRTQGRTLRETAEWLNRLGVLVRPNGRPWDVRSVQAIVLREDQLVATEKAAQAAMSIATGEAPATIAADAHLADSGAVLPVASPAEPGSHSAIPTGAVR